MNWTKYVQQAVNLLEARRVPSSEEIIFFIKRVNPTSLNLSDSQREVGYDLKSKLQSQLLEHYGESFKLEPHPIDQDIVLIKHKLLASVDACHANRNRLSREALDQVLEDFPAIPVKEAPNNTTKTIIFSESSPDLSPKEVLYCGQQLLAEYEYDAAKEVFSRIKIHESEEIPLLLSSINTLINEIGSYDAAINALLMQPKAVLKDKRVREIMALTYSNNNMLPEARAIFETLASNDLSKEALFAYADINFKDKNFSLAYSLINAAEEKEGFVPAYAGLRNEVEAALLRDSDPIYLDAMAAFEQNDIDTAKTLCREALDICPKHKLAKSLISLIEEMILEEELKLLWSKIEGSDQDVDKLVILERLQEIDRCNREKIKELIFKEKDRKISQSILNQVANLKELVKEENFERAFDLILSLQRHEDKSYLFNHIFSLSPFFILLEKNKALQRLPASKAKVSWLEYINAHRNIKSGKFESYFPILETMKPLFQGYQLFKNDLKKVLTFEQEKGRDLLKRLVQRIKHEDCSVAEAEIILQEMKRAAALLPLVERNHVVEVAKKRIQDLKPQTPEGVLLGEFHEALLIGDLAKADSIRKSIDDKEAIARIDAEVKEKYVIITEKINFIISDSLSVDMATESEEYLVLARTSDELFLRESETSIVRIRPKKQQAIKYTSEYFSNSVHCDSLPSKEVYLFKNADNCCFKIYLGEHSASIMSSFLIEDRLSSEADETIYELFLSSEKDSEVYYLSITDPDENNDVVIRVVKQDIFKNALKDCISKKVSDTCANLLRLTHAPDRFLFEVDSEYCALSKKLEDMNKYIPAMMISCEHESNSVYFCNGTDIFEYDSSSLKERSVLEEFFNDWFFYDDILGINLTERIALFQQGQFYKSGGYLSNKVQLSRILCCKTPTDFYYFEYDTLKKEIKVRPLSKEIDQFVTWSRH